MKIIYGILMVALLAAACGKSGVKVDSSKLQGKWKLTESYSSDGSTGQWQPVAQKQNYDYVQFDVNGKLEGTMYNKYSSYALTDSVTLTFSTADNLEHYRYALQAGTLTLNPSGPVICIEGCGDRFVKVSN